MDKNLLAKLWECATSNIQNAQITIHHLTVHRIKNVYGIKDFVKIGNALMHHKI